MVAATAPFSERLRASVDASGSLLCVGLDPAGSSAAEIERECRQLIAATIEFACAVKANAAFFERHGSRGYAVLERLRAEVPADRMLIIDAKRGDIGNTARAYATALFDVLGADAVTINPLMGRDSVAPYLERADRGVLLLARTSNPGAADFLDQPAGERGRPLYERLVVEGASWAEPGRVGFVVGATAPEAIATVRRLVPTAPLLLPGVGAQGADLGAAVRAALDAGRGGALVAVSRGIANAPAGPGPAARRLRDEVEAIRAER